MLIARGADQKIEVVAAKFGCVEEIVTSRFEVGRDGFWCCITFLLSMASPTT
jgi:hypothetical protein